MEPTLHCALPGAGCLATVADVVLARPFRAKDAIRGGILLFQTPPSARLKCGAGGLFIKRVIGLPGETVQEKLFGGKGYILIDGRRLEEPYVRAGRRDSRTGTWHVPKGRFFFLGDNRAQSCDSREWGSVPKANLRWTVVSIDRDGRIIPIR